MFEDHLWQQLFTRIRKHQFLTGICGLVISLLMGTIGFIYWVWQVNSSLANITDPVFSPNPSTFSDPDSLPTADFLTVSITGAVAHPGIFQVTPQSRVADLIKIAGGFSGQADSLVISQTLNLVDQLHDGQQLFIPSFNSSSSNIDQEISNTQQLISLNSASAKELESLVGVGQKKAQDIIDGRPFTTIDELVTKKILSANQLTKISAQLTL